MALATLRSRVRRVQELENSAADKVGALFLVIDEARLGDEAYVSEWIEKALTAIGPEVLEAEETGRKLSAEVGSKEEKR